MWVVVMYEPAIPGEKLTLSEQTNEVFGPFTAEKEADEWTARMADIYKVKRQWLIIELSNPSVVNKLDTLVN